MVVGGVYSFKFYQANVLKTYYSVPQEKDIYIFKFGEKYSLYYLDFFTVDSMYFFSNKYDFSNALPLKNQINDSDFIFQYYHIYEKEEIERFYKNKTLVKIYR